ncbi:MAG TPA: hypothetical protein VFO86_00430, partial [Terriglobia bacterium]|nr:hypothetical protein [Terriglobia bacterium]
MDESEAVADLRRNPLMLALMCIIYRGQNWIPRNRPDMYEHCANLLFDKWDSSRQIYVELKAKAYVDPAIKHLAWWMFTESGGTQGVTESVLVNETAQFLTHAFQSQSETQAAARQFVEFCRGRAWVLTDVGTNADGESLFAFTHRTFLEYFAAYELTRRHNGPEQVAKTLLPHVSVAEWGIVAELAVQISNKHSKDGASRVLKSIISDRRYRSSSSRNNIMRFAYRCLGFTHVPVSLAEEIARDFVEAILQFGVDTTRLASERCLIVPELASTVESTVVSRLANHIENRQLKTSDVAIEVTLELPRILGGTDSLGEDGRWTARRAELFGNHEPEILSKFDEATWISAWRNGLISLEKLMCEGPRS